MLGVNRNMNVSEIWFEMEQRNDKYRYLIYFSMYSTRNAKDWKTVNINPFLPNVSYLYPLKIPENLWNGLKLLCQFIILTEFFQQRNKNLSMLKILINHVKINVKQYLISNISETENFDHQYEEISLWFVICKRYFDRCIVFPKSRIMINQPIELGRNYNKYRL